MTAPLLPSKHVHLDESIIGLGAHVLNRLAKPRSVDSLITAINADRATHDLPTANDDVMMIVISFLYAVGAISIDHEDRLCRDASD